MKEWPAPGESGGFLDCGSKKLWLLMPYHIAKAMVLLMIGRHPNQRRQTVIGSTVEGPVTQILGVRGDVRIGDSADEA